MPPKGDRPSAAAPAKDKSSKSAAPAAKDKSAAAAPAKGGFGGFTSMRDMFDGGGPGKSRPAAGPTAANRPKARPDVLKTGTGKDTRYIDTKTGKSYAAPSYGAFSFKGLTSTDPANVLRNRYGTDIRPMRGIEPANRGGKDRKKSGIASLAPTPAPAPPAPTSAELAAIGAPTTPMAPIFVDSPAYTQYDSLDVLGPVGGYGSAFGPVDGYGMPLPINWTDIFNTYPDFNTR
jgi:hypothetical protein